MTTDPMKPLAGRSAIVTGSGRNLGRGAREVADVADGGFHHIVRTKKLGDGAGLGG